MSGDTTVVAGRRFDDLVIRVQGEETLVLDTRTDTAHCLPAEIDRIWRACVRGRTLAQVAEIAGVDEETAAAGIEQLTAVDLLDVSHGVDRRGFLRRGALVGGAAAAIPLIQSVAGPSALAAATAPPPSCNSIITQTGCSGNKATYTLQVSGLAPNTSYSVSVVYKNGTVHDSFSLTTNGSGNGTVSQTTGAAIPQGGVHDVQVTLTGPGGTVTCQDNNLTFSAC